MRKVYVRKLETNIVSGPEPLAEELINGVRMYMWRRFFIKKNRRVAKRAHPVIS
jgi:hypothetical protein